MPVIDWSDVKAPEPVEAGTYPAKFTGHKLTEKSQSSGKPFIRLEFTLDGEEGVNGKKMFRNASLQPQSLWMLKQTMITMGADPELFEGEFDIEEELTELIGADVILEVSLQPSTRDEGGMVNQVDRIKDPTFS